ncbi:VOC family protein [uncultured Roseibium sp.]|uniref:VOC family protein n=1 Tax=uncultured Roseibium sp. TaxID=1936171 RepID=UPI00261D400E|nr:VOC family protein [uncultured Roseibium sp.]
MKFVNPLPFVSDIERSKRFYTETLALRILEDHGNFVLFENGFALHDGQSLHETVFGTEDTSDAPYGRKNLVLYFEVEDVTATCQHVASRTELIHEVRKEPWGQRVFRLFDPDGHIIEIGEPQ